MLLSNLTADGNTPVFSAGDGNEVILIIEGTFGSGTASIQVQGTSGNWVTLTDGTGTSDFAKRVYSANAKLRVNLSGATTPSLNVTSHMARPA